MTKRQQTLVITDSIDVNDSNASKGRVALVNNLHKSGVQLKGLHFTRKMIRLDEIPCMAVKEQKVTVVYTFSELQLLLRRFTDWNNNTQHIFQRKLKYIYNILEK